MSLQQGAIDPIHVPQRRDVFQFDAEVSSIFDNMAVRSIPMYEEVHRLHASLLDRMFDLSKICLLDIGASTGASFRALCNQLQTTDNPVRFAMAVENSPHMADRLREDFPWLHVTEHDITKGIPVGIRPDVIYMLYVLQFIEPVYKIRVLEYVYSLLPPGGVLILGQKDAIDSGFSGALQEEYVQFRLDNGYTQAEIDAKTTALAGSMWPSTQEHLEQLLRRVGFVTVQETSRWLAFNTIMAIK